MKNGAKVILCSHLGKPKGEWKPELSLCVVAKRLSELLGQEVIMAKDVVGEDAKAKAAALQEGQVMLLENVRYMAGETKNDPALSKEWPAWRIFMSMMPLGRPIGPTPPQPVWQTICLQYAAT